MIEIINKIMADYNKKESEIFEKCLRENASPPIRGEITKGKLRWRGITLCHQNNGLDPTERWLEQRGTKISPIVSMKFPQL